MNPFDGILAEESEIATRKIKVTAHSIELALRRYFFGSTSSDCIVEWELNGPFGKDVEGLTLSVSTVQKKPARPPAKAKDDV
jgi:hypothetical protein